MRELIAVYIMASGKHGTLYVGVTGDLIYRVERHRSGELGGFTQRYGVKSLVWYETHETMGVAIAREKSLKKYRRQWKVNLIEEANPDWRDLFGGLVKLAEASPLGIGVDALPPKGRHRQAPP